MCADLAEKSEFLEDAVRTLKSENEEKFMNFALKIKKNKALVLESK